MISGQTAPAEIEVLLATFNGERFLRSQIESILHQSWAATRILARDDGSTDGTCDLLAEYAMRFPERFRVLPTDRPTGSAQGNFLILLQHATGRRVAFADQDDVWLPSKLELENEALSKLEHTFGLETPLLVFSDLEVVDEELCQIHESFWAHEGLDPDDASCLQRLLLQNVVTGCTMLINNSMAKLAARMPEAATMHDHWIALLACLFGRAAYISHPLVRYRQHLANAIGAKRSLTLKRFLQALTHAGRRKHWALVQGQAATLLRMTESGALPRLSKEREGTVSAFVACGSNPNRVRRIATVLQHGFVYSSLRRTLTLLWSL